MLTSLCIYAIGCLGCFLFLSYDEIKEFLRGNRKMLLLFLSISVLWPLFLCLSMFSMIADKAEDSEPP